MLVKETTTNTLLIVVVKQNNDSGVGFCHCKRLSLVAIHNLHKSKVMEILKSQKSLLKESSKLLKIN